MMVVKKLAQKIAKILQSLGICVKIQKNSLLEPLFSILC